MKRFNLQNMKRAKENLASLGGWRIFCALWEPRLCSMCERKQEGRVTSDGRVCDVEAGVGPGVVGVEEDTGCGSSGADRGGVTGTAPPPQHRVRVQKPIPDLQTQTAL